MEEPQQRLQADEEVTLVVSGEEATLVSPRFDDEEALVARPVVPLEGEAVEEPAVAAAALAPRRPARTLRGYAPRRSWVLGLVLVSVLVGGVLGGAGLYLYQRQSRGDGGAGAAGVTTLAETPAETQQPTAAEAENAPPPAEQAQPESPAADARTAEARPAEPSAVDGDTDDSAASVVRAREPETAPAVERRDDADAGGNAGTRQRGKKGENDDEGERSVRRRSRPDSDVPVARDNTDAREARRVDSIVYRPRRAARRERMRRDPGGDTDRLRRIFEGTPE